MKTLRKCHLLKSKLSNILEKEKIPMGRLHCKVKCFDSVLESYIIVPKSVFSFNLNLHAKSLPERDENYQ